MSFLKVLRASRSWHLHSFDVACIVVVIHVAKHDATMQPIISMCQCLCEHLLFPCEICNGSGCVCTCHSRRKSFMAVVFAVIGALCSVAWLLIAHDGGSSSLLLCRWFCGSSGKVSMRVLCCIALFICCIVGVGVSLTVCVGVGVCRLWHKECVHRQRPCALCAATGKQESFCSSAMVE